MFKSMIIHMLIHVIIYMLKVRNDGWDCKCTYINYVLDRYVLDFYCLNPVVDLTASLRCAMLYFASLCTTSSSRYARFATLASLLVVWGPRSRSLRYVQQAHLATLVSLCCTTLRSLLGPTYIYFFKNLIRTKKSQS